MRTAFESPWLPSKVMTMPCVFLARIVSPVLTVNDGLSTWNEYVVVCAKIFLNGIWVVPAALTVNGPCGFGGRQWPTNGKTYSPPMDEATDSVALKSPSLDGSNVTSTFTSLPLEAAEAAFTERSTRKSEESVCKRTFYQKIRFIENCNWEIVNVLLG